MDDKPNNVPMLHLFEKRNLANGGAGNAFVLLLEANLLQSDCLIGGAVASLVNDAVCSLAYLLHLLVLQKKKMERKSEFVRGK